ncbi:P-loop NTPase [bacterium]|nr:P-loop NTPase [bacterium]
MSYLDDSLRRKAIFFTGKGGVGKSTLAWATALACQRRGRKVAVVGWQPAGKPAPPALVDLGIPWLGLDTLTTFKEYALTLIKFERLYDSVLDNRVLRTFVLAAPGLSDAVIAGKIWELVNRGEYETLLIDMPSSGHAKAFFKSPLGLKKIFKMGFIARDTERVLNLFQSNDVRLDLVTLPEELPLRECQLLKGELQALHSFSFGYAHFNQCLPNFAAFEPTELDRLEGEVERFARAVSTEHAEQASRMAAHGLGLPTVKIPRFATAGWKASVQSTADFLEAL